MKLTRQQRLNLAENCRRLKADDARKDSYPRIAKGAGLSLDTIDKAFGCADDVGFEEASLQKLADYFSNSPSRKQPVTVKDLLKRPPA